MIRVIKAAFDKAFLWLHLLPACWVLEVGETVQQIWQARTLKASAQLDLCNQQWLATRWEISYFCTLVWIVLASLDLRLNPDIRVKTQASYWAFTKPLGFHLTSTLLKGDWAFDIYCTFIRLLRFARVSRFHQNLNSLITMLFREKST